MYLKLKTQIINIELLSGPLEETLEWSGKIVIWKLVRLVSATFRTVLEYSVGGKYFYKF